MEKLKHNIGQIPTRTKRLVAFQLRFLVTKTIALLLFDAYRHFLFSSFILPRLFYLSAVFRCRDILCGKMQCAGKSKDHPLPTFPVIGGNRKRNKIIFTHGGGSIVCM